ncbi:MAG: rod shape-determining protein MreC [Actinomycetota bacterium]|nr:rod shape-determining protein MreC [Actinomycetota bacterium]
MFTVAFGVAAVALLSQKPRRASHPAPPPASVKLTDAQRRRETNLDRTLGLLSSYRFIDARVTVHDPTLWYTTVTIDKGAKDGVRLNDPVLGDGGLVGKIEAVRPVASIVMLITAPFFAATAEVQDAKGDHGVLLGVLGDPNQLNLRNLPPNASASDGQVVVTAGFKSHSLRPFYPAGIPIGHVANANPLAPREVRVTPVADLRHLAAVQIILGPATNSSTVKAPRSP